jgi:serine/threonine-protein kinase RsbW/stage II sporulation protein AB (anti-sigma F factor)
MSANGLHDSRPARPDAIGELRRAVVDYARGAGADTEVVQSVRLAVSEALTNVAMHAYRGRSEGDMLAEAWTDDHHLVVRVSDDGLGLVPRTDSPGMGIGLAVMAQAADEFTIANRVGAPGTLVELRFALG